MTERTVKQSHDDESGGDILQVVRKCAGVVVYTLAILAGHLCLLFIGLLYTRVYYYYYYYINCLLKYLLVRVPLHVEQQRDLVEAPLLLQARIYDNEPDIYSNDIHQ